MPVLLWSLFFLSFVFVMIVETYINVAESILFESIRTCLVQKKSVAYYFVRKIVAHRATLLFSGILVLLHIVIDNNDYNDIYIQK